MDISLFLFSAALFFQPDIQQVDDRSLGGSVDRYCEFLGVDYPLGQKIMVSVNGKISHKRCLLFKNGDASSIVVDWVEVRT